MKLKDTLVAATAAILLLVLTYLWLSDDGIKVAPTIDITLLDGKILSLKDLRGQPVLVTFWATTCIGCRREVPHLIALYNKYQPQGLEIVAIAMYYDPPAQVLTFKQQKNLPYTVALDLKNEAAQAFGGVRLTPTTFVINKKGRIVFQKIGEFNVEAMDTLIKGLIAEPKA
ncbi:MAG TPA: TlpA family protein disulfide reductase [Acidiferrobacteraceae bacterium]|nr:TlpA family protein disulfide reductase [Acidiferrobacteraceae bacterium]